MMTVQQPRTIFLATGAFLIVALILPFLLAFDSLLYWMTRPTCLSCGSLVDYIRGASLSAGFAGGLLQGAGVRLPAWVTALGASKQKKMEVRSNHMKV